MIASNKSTANGDDFPVTGDSGSVPDFLINGNLPEIAPDSDALLADLSVLMAQRPDDFNFRAPDLRTLNDKAKRQLLIDIQESVGIKSLERLTS